MDSLCSCDHAVMSSGRLFKAYIDDSPFYTGPYLIMSHPVKFFAVTNRTHVYIFLDFQSLFNRSNDNKL